MTQSSHIFECFIDIHILCFTQVTKHAATSYAALWKEQDEVYKKSLLKFYLYVDQYLNHRFVSVGFTVCRAGKVSTKSPLLDKIEKWICLSEEKDCLCKIVQDPGL